MAFSITLGLLAFFYGVRFFRKYDLKEVIETKDGIGFYEAIKEHSFFVLFAILGLSMTAFIENESHTLAYVSVFLTGLFLYLYRFGGVGEGSVTIGKLELVETEKGIGRLEIVAGLFGFAIASFVGWSVYSSGTDFAFPLSLPIVYSLLWSISRCDRIWKLIPERFLFALSFAGVSANAFFWNISIETVIAFFLLWGAFLIGVGILENVTGRTGFGYMDVPVAIAVSSMMFEKSFVFFGIMFGLSVFMSAITKERQTGLFSYSSVALLITAVWYLNVGL